MFSWTQEVSDNYVTSNQHQVLPSTVPGILAENYGFRESAYVHAKP